MSDQLKFWLSFSFECPDRSLLQGRQTSKWSFKAIDWRWSYMKIPLVHFVSWWRKDVSHTQSHFCITNNFKWKIQLFFNPTLIYFQIQYFQPWVRYGFNLVFLLYLFESFSNFSISSFIANTVLFISWFTVADFVLLNSKIETFNVNPSSIRG